MLPAIIMAIITFTGIVQPWHIIILTFLLGIVNTFESPSGQAIVYFIELFQYCV